MNDHYVLKITIAPSNIGVFPANICWSSRPLQDVLKTCLEDVLKTCLDDILKTYLEDVFKTSWKQKNVYWGYLYLINLNVYVFDLTNLYVTNLYLTNLKRIQNALIRTQ